MPRIDNTDPQVMWLTATDPALLEDPGQIPPIDLCQYCFWQWEAEHDLNLAAIEVDHPPYEEGEYDCHDCEEPLTASDNWADGGDYAL